MLSASEQGEPWSTESGVWAGGGKQSLNVFVRSPDIDQIRILMREHHAARTKGDAQETAARFLVSLAHKRGWAPSRYQVTLPCGTCSRFPSKPGHKAAKWFLRRGSSGNRHAVQSEETLTRQRCGRGAKVPDNMGIGEERTEGALAVGVKLLGREPPGACVTCRGQPPPGVRSSRSFLVAPRLRCTMVDMATSQAQCQSSCPGLFTRCEEDKWRSS